MTSLVRRVARGLGDDADLRAVASPLLNEMGFHPDWIERQLAHDERTLRTGVTMPKGIALSIPLAKNPNCDQPSSDLAGNYRRIFGELRNLVKRREVWAVTDGTLQVYVSGPSLA